MTRFDCSGLGGSLWMVPLTGLVRGGSIRP